MGEPCGPVLFTHLTRVPMQHIESKQRVIFPILKVPAPHLARRSSACVPIREVPVPICSYWHQPTLGSHRVKKNVEHTQPLAHASNTIERGGPFDKAFEMKSLSWNCEAVNRCDRR